MSSKGPSLLAMAIDDRLKSILIASITHILDTYSIGLGEVLHPETHSLVDLVYWCYTCMQFESTPGMKAFRLEFTGKMRRVLGCLLIVFHWLQQRLLKNALLGNWRRSQVCPVLQVFLTEYF